MLVFSLHTVLPPRVSFSLDTDGQGASDIAKAATYNGTAVIGTVVSLRGTAMLDPLVDSEVTVSRSWARQGSPDIMNFNESTTTTSVTTSLSFAPLTESDAGIYVFTVRVTSPNPIYILSAPDLITKYTILPEAYPAMDIQKSVSSGECGVNQTVILTGNVILHPNTSANHNLTYVWTGTDGRNITASTDEDLSADGGSLVVKKGDLHRGNYSLRACLTIPSTDVKGHCNTAEYVISADGEF